MRLTGVLGVLMFVAAPAMGDAVLYTFDLLEGSSTLDLSIRGVASTNTGLTGTFAVTIYSSDGHIGESDTFNIAGPMGSAFLTNTDTVQLGLVGIATATVEAGSAQILQFLPEGPGHIGPGGNTSVNTDAYFEATVIVTGAFETTFTTATSAGSLLPMPMNFTTSVSGSQVITAVIDISIPNEIEIPDLGLTITLDLIVHVEATAHVVPDPAFGGFTALGLGGAGAWLRRRRS